LPGAYARELIDLCARFDVAPAALVSGLDVAPETLTNPATRVPLATFVQLVRRAEALTGEPGLAYYAGLHTRVSWHGFLGFAAMTASTVGEALELAERFSRTRTEAVSLVTRRDGAHASLFLEEHVPLGELREFLVTTLLLGLVAIADTLVGRPLAGRVDMTHAEPAYFGKFAAAVPRLREVRFGQPANRILFATATLSLPIVSADPAATQLAREQCERELLALGDGSPVVGRLRALLRDGVSLSSPEAAKRLSMSSRTLKRRLTEQGTTFSELLDDARRQKALVLLEDRRLTVDQMAAQLGYSDAANFTRAFRRWTGKSPGEARDGR